MREEADLFIIDEVGKMELFSSSFLPAVLRILESNIPVLASVPIPKAGRNIPGGLFSNTFIVLYQISTTSFTSKILMPFIFR